MGNLYFSVRRKWIMENGEGHWAVTNGLTTVHCDDSELRYVESELEDELLRHFGSRLF